MPAWAAFLLVFLHRSASGFRPAPESLMQKICTPLDETDAIATKQHYTWEVAAADRGRRHQGLRARAGIGLSRPRHLY